MSVVDRSPLLPVVIQHAEDAAVLRGIRSILVRAPHVKLLHLKRHDERIAAHLDGLRVAGSTGAALSRELLAAPSAGAVFPGAVLAIEERDTESLVRLLAIARVEPAACRRGLLSAFGWAPPTALRGLSKELLGSDDPFDRGIGLLSCVLHGVPMAAALVSALEQDDALLRADALRGIGRLGRTDMLPMVMAALADDDEACRFDAACAAALLGERQRSVAELEIQATPGNPRRPSSLKALMQVLEPRQLRPLLRQLSENAGDQQLLIRSVGLAGDPHFGPWLVSQMAAPHLARVAGEAFSLITGLDLAYLDLDQSEPAMIETGPTDDPSDDDVALDEDENLPWPDVGKLSAWWKVHGARFTPGVRHFAGQPLSRARCIEVLRSGFQRQRIVAAHQLSLLGPGTPLFNCAAPAWRQEQLLAGMA